MTLGIILLSEEQCALIESALVVRLVHTYIEPYERVKTKELLDDVRITKKQIWKRKEG